MAMRRTIERIFVSLPTYEVAGQTKILANLAEKIRQWQQDPNVDLVSLFREPMELDIPEINTDFSEELNLIAKAQTVPITTPFRLTHPYPKNSLTSYLPPFNFNYENHVFHYP